MKEQEFFENMGVHFVGFVGQYGYDRVLSLLGRHVRDFLNGKLNGESYWIYEMTHFPLQMRDRIILTQNDSELFVGYIFVLDCSYLGKGRFPVS